MINEYPLYILSKGRANYSFTARSFDRMGVNYSVVIEPQELEEYKRTIDEDKLLILPFNDGGSSVPARNWIINHSKSLGYSRVWIVDDNIKDFYRFHNNLKARVYSPNFFRTMEDFVDRYTNVALAGPQYEMFVPRKSKPTPFILNTRVYSCILYNNELDYEFRGQYNEDTDLSLRALKDGWCTVLFNTFLADKIKTMNVKGGNTEQVYGNTNNRYEFAQSLKEQHPDVVDIVWRYDRWHHQVDYSPFKSNRLQMRDDVEVSNENNNYNLRLVKWKDIPKDFQ